MKLRPRKEIEMSKMLVLALLAMLSAAGQEFPNAQTLPAVTITCETMPKLCPPTKGAVEIQQEKDGCTTWYDNVRGYEVTDCGRGPMTCAGDCGIRGSMSPGIRDLVWNGGVKTIHRPYVLEPGDVVKVYNNDIVPECHVVIVTFNKKTKFVKIDCKELYD